jgi:hypothetical protein
MSKVQILVTTMHQTDDRKFDEMNLQTDAVIANQADFEDFEKKMHGENKVCFVTTRTRGLSKNRNIAIENISADAEYVVFSDDDLVWKDGYENIILDAFEKHPECPVLKFNLNCVSERKIAMKRFKEFHIATRREVGSWGVCGVAMKADILREGCLNFNERFGTGTPNYCGEDSIFLQELFKKKYKTGCIPDVVADIDQADSSWFKGHDEKYFTVAGMILQEIYPVLCYPLIARSAIRAAKRGDSNMAFWKILMCYFRGTCKNIREKGNLRK